MMKTIVIAATALLALSVSNAFADEWSVGPGVSYVSNINHVVDIYKANVRAQGRSVDVRKAIPVGVGFDIDYLLNTGLRIGAGIGPYFRLSGDVKHFELPLSGTMGYSFRPEEQATPYLKAGVVYHAA